MKFTCVKKDIEHAVDVVSKVVAHNAALPVLQCVVFEVSEGSVVLKATNLEIGVTYTLTTNTNGSGTYALPAQVLLATLKTAPQNTDITFEHTGTSVVCTMKGAVTTIHTVAHEEFPNIPQPETDTHHTLASHTLTTGIRSVLYAASTSRIKPELASVYCYHEAGELYFVATDSFRLAEKRISYKTQDDIPSVIIPVKNATELVRILETQEPGDVRVSVDENQYSVSYQALYVTSRIIDGSFPDYKAILPKTSTSHATLLKEDLLNTLKKTQVFSDTFGKITFHLHPQEKKLTVRANNNTVGEISDSLDAAIEGDDIDISFNYRLLLDVFQSLTTSDSVTLSFSGIGKPMVIRGVGDTTFTYLVMPMNR